MNNIQIPTIKFELLETFVAKSLYGVPKKEAIRQIQSADLCYRIIQEDRKSFPVTTKDYISHRLNLSIKNGKITNVTIG
jgi:hypothetical protein